MLARPLTLAAVVAGLAGAAAAADWPQWRGPNRDGKAADAGLLAQWPAGGPKLLWAVDDLAAVGTGYGAPAVVGDRLFLVGAADESQEAKESVVCLSARDGKVVWKTPLETSPGTFKLQGWGRGPRSTPTVDGDRIYVLGVMGDLVCVAAADGRPVWRTNLVKDLGGRIPQWGYSESPLVDADKVVVTPGAKGGLAALSKATGRVVWQCRELTQDAGYSSAVAADGGGVRQYVQQNMGAGFGVRAADGKLLWQSRGMARSVAVIPTPVVADGHVFFTNGYTNGCELVKLDPDGQGGTTATPVYKSTALMANHHGGVIALGDHIYGHTEHDKSGRSERGKGTWVCIPWRTGGDDPVWRSDKLEKGSVTFADGHLFCYGEATGTLVRIKATPEGWQEAGRFTIPKKSRTRPNQGKVWPHPVVANGLLYLRDYELVYCYDLRSPGA